MPRQFAHVFRSVNMEWGFKENRVAVISLYKCGKSDSQIFELLKTLKISRNFVYWAIKRYKEICITSKANSASANSVVVTGNLCQLIYVVLATGRSLKCLKKIGPCESYRGHVAMRYRVIAKSAFWLCCVCLSVHMELLDSRRT